MSKRKGEVKISVKGNPFNKNTGDEWNFGVWKVDNMHVDWDIKQLLDIIKKLGGNG
jgi:hypothetical protein